MRLGVAVVASLIIGLAAGPVAAPAGAQEPPWAGDHDGVLTADGSQRCAEQRFEQARPAADGLAQEQFVAGSPHADDLRRRFAQADQDGDGLISREEWIRWFGPAQAGTTEGASSRPVGSD